ncbi:MAG TPA: SRPBCC family protein, partial [Candidatus Dormibacteraeota bacterium]|nr:SRPBCC family protein [Candidatus Dormibacteraeota bacterium]
TAAIEIAAPRQAVWDYIFAPERHFDFMEGMSSWRSEGRRRMGLGARFAAHMRIGPVDLGSRIEIVEFDPPCDMAWTAITGIEHRGRWRLRRNGERTVVELRAIYHAPGRIVAPLVELIAAPIVQGYLTRSLAVLKQQIEALPRSAAPAARPARAQARRRTPPAGAATRRSPARRGRRRRAHGSHQPPPSRPVRPRR